jgi:phosphatidylserine decarboxylase precursor-related protein
MIKINNFELSFHYFHPIIHNSLFVLIIASLFTSYYLFSFLLFIYLLLQYFYRFPIKHKIPYYTNYYKKNSIVSPSYGKILKIEKTKNYYRISTFLNITDIHFQYFPTNGKVIDRKYSQGSFYPAYLLEKTKYNERCSTIIRTDDGYHVEVIQIAGILAHAIDTFYEISNYETSKYYYKGELLGLIHLGSRVDTIIPKYINIHNKYKKFKLIVNEKDKLIGGETILGYYE